MDLQLVGRVAVVTGSGQGIGRSIAIEFAREKVNVALLDINLESAASVSDEIRKLGVEALPVKADITKKHEVDEAFDKITSKFGRVDILVNNAGWDMPGPFIESNEETWDKTIAINLKGAIICSRAALNVMVEKKSGKIVSISSDAGRVGSTGETVYSAAKGGIIAFTKSLAREVARYSINVNCVAPGPTNTQLFAKLSPKLAEAMKNAIPFRRIAEPEDISPVVVFLASHAARYITGQCISVSGGLTMI